MSTYSLTLRLCETRSPDCESTSAAATQRGGIVLEPGLREVESSSSRTPTPQRPTVTPLRALSVQTFIKYNPHLTRSERIVLVCTLPHGAEKQSPKAESDQLEPAVRSILPCPGHCRADRVGTVSRGAQDADSHLLSHLVRRPTRRAGQYANRQRLLAQTPGAVPIGGVRIVVAVPDYSCRRRFRPPARQSRP